MGQCAGVGDTIYFEKMVTDKNKIEKCLNWEFKDLNMATFFENFLQRLSKGASCQLFPTLSSERTTERQV